MDCGMTRDVTLTRDEIAREISAELAARRAAWQDDPSVPGEVGLLFYTSPDDFAEQATDLLARLQGQFRSADAEGRAKVLNSTVRICLGLRSAQVHWSLTDAAEHGGNSMDEKDLVGSAARFLKALREVCEEARVSADRVCQQWRERLAARYRAERLDESEAADEALALTADGLPSMVEALTFSISQSNVRRFVQCGHTDFGNDYATCLDYPLLLGASFVTTNPPLVLMALKEGVLPEDELSSLCAERPPWLSPAAVATRLAVRQNAAALRPLFLCSSGNKGYVCLQVDPRYETGEQIVQEALHQYQELRRDLGGLPNVVFKVPATKAGLDASAALAERGIGTTATVCFGLFQAMRFAEVMSAGHALTSYVVVMNGRLAGPVVEELDPGLAGAGRLAGVAVTKRLQQELYGNGRTAKGYDSARVRILVASLRDYSGAIPDVEETLGVPVITVFPDIRRAFDASTRQLDVERVWRDLDEEILHRLAQSEIFRQAYYLPGDADKLRPKQPLSLEQDALVQEWAPVQRTMTGFSQAYAEAEELVLEKISGGGQ